MWCSSRPYMENLHSDVTNNWYVGRGGWRHGVKAPPAVLGVWGGGFESTKCYILYWYTLLKERMLNIGITEKGYGGIKFASPPHLMEWNPLINFFFTFLPKFGFWNSTFMQRLIIFGQSCLPLANIKLGLLFIYVNAGQPIIKTFM
jgi:hypothetical protein